MHIVLDHFIQRKFLIMPTPSRSALRRRKSTLKKPVARVEEADAQLPMVEESAGVTAAGSGDRSSGGAPNDLLLENCLKTTDCTKRFQFGSSLACISAFWDYPKYVDKIRAIATNPMWQDRISSPGFSAEIKTLIRKMENSDSVDDVPAAYRDIEKTLEDVVEVIEDRTALSSKTTLNISPDIVEDLPWKEKHVDQLGMQSDSSPMQDDTIDDALPEGIVICDFATAADWKADLHDLSTVQSMIIDPVEETVPTATDEPMGVDSASEDDGTGYVGIPAAGSGNRSSGRAASVPAPSQSTNTSKAQAQESKGPDRPYDVFTEDFELL